MKLKVSFELDAKDACNSAANINALYEEIDYAMGMARLEPLNLQTDNQDRIVQKFQVDVEQ